MNAYGLFILAIGLMLTYLGVTAKAGQILSHVKSQAGTTATTPTTPVTTLQPGQPGFIGPIATGPVPANGPVASSVVTR